MSPDLQALLFNTVVPAIAAFAVAHFHLLLPAPKTPAPVIPAPTPGLPIIRPVGQGGILDLVGYFVTQILASSAPQDAKQAAINKIAEASNLVAVKN